LHTLGLSIKETALSKKDWQPLIERVDKRLATWKENALSKEGRLILVNYALSSMPLYFMSFFFLLDWVIRAIDQIRYAFFWKGTRKIHRELYLINWKLICSYKSQDGLGVCNLHAFNLASGGGDSSMTHLLHGWASLFITTIEEEGHTTCTIL